MNNNLKTLHVVFGVLALLWFITLVIIERMGPGFVRFYVGDVMVTGFLFWCVLAVRPALNALYVGLSILVLALTVEVLQLFGLDGLRELLGRKTSTLVLGNNFDWGDLLAYLIGLIICMGMYQLIVFWTKDTGNEAV